MTTNAFNLDSQQQRAADVRGVDVIVTAGAGSGKTRTLVARYMGFVEEGVSPRQILAITFTEKAAREMRNRIREAVRERAISEPDPSRQAAWLDLEAGMDAARIGTIHSFCAELLRWHPAEAGVDPGFEVIEEGAAALLKIQSVEAALAWAVEDEKAAPLYAAFSVRTLERTLLALLNRRLDAGRLIHDQGAGTSGVNPVDKSLGDFMTDPQVAACIRDLAEMHASGIMIDDIGEMMASQIEGLLAGWKVATRALASGQTLETAVQLFRLRREGMSLKGGKRTSRAKESLKELQQLYDAEINPWLGGKGSKDVPPDAETEARFLEDRDRLAALFDRAAQIYRQALDLRHSLDFDDLEGRARDLLQQPQIRRRWRKEIEVLLIDEFQDTNQRQQDIVDALSGGAPGHLFVVGDARQSIYRFRGADVTVFRGVGDAIKARGGAEIELDTTYRTQAHLLEALDALLPPLMGDPSTQLPPYRVPYTPMTAHRGEPRPGVAAPYVELVIGTGENAEAARPQAARVLVDHLIKLRGEEQVQTWEDVALLFRASTGFPAYEDALQEAGVPFVTVAGQGFYDRPEIRDVLNILRALADPWDDPALAGLLRSPAFGLTDPGLYQLRWDGKATRPLQLALRGDMSALETADQEAAARAREIIEELAPLADRLPVGELLKRTLDRTDYRAILATTHNRYWRNVDKLLNDAHMSQLVSVRAFLEYIRSARDVGAREGEAPAEAQGAVRLMTIHKAKGLEFPVVVLADAARQAVNTSEPVYLIPETGLTFKPDRQEAQPLAYRLARQLDQQRGAAEESRLLYVAATRAQEKLLISGHATGAAGRWSTKGWMKDFTDELELNLNDLIDGPDQRGEITRGDRVRIEVIASADRPGEWEMGPEAVWPESRKAALFKPLPAAKVDEVIEGEEPARDWRATGVRLHPPAAVVGLMVHRALEYWLFPGDDSLEALLENMALDRGLVHEKQRARAIKQAKLLLARFQAHPLWEEVEAAAARYHELPYTNVRAGRSEDLGVIDLLYQQGDGWVVVDFKADEIQDEASLEEAIEKYRPQLRRYLRAGQIFLEGRVEARLCFLDMKGEIYVERVGP